MVRGPTRWSHSHPTALTPSAGDPGEVPALGLVCTKWAGYTGSPLEVSWDGQESELGQPVPCRLHRQWRLLLTEGEEEEEEAAVAVVAAGAATLRTEKRRSRPQERVRVLGVRLQSFCLSL